MKAMKKKKKLTMLTPIINNVFVFTLQYRCAFGNVLAPLLLQSTNTNAYSVFWRVTDSVGISWDICSWLTMWICPCVINVELCYTVLDGAKKAIVKIVIFSQRKHGSVLLCCHNVDMATMQSFKNITVFLWSAVRIGSPPCQQDYAANTLYRLYVWLISHRIIHTR